jgi:hypothetical protein
MGTMTRKTFPLLALVVTIILSAAAVMDQLDQHTRNPQLTAEPVLTKQSETHILYGDDRGGGHLHGAGKPCKSEFPAEWDKQDIINNVSAIAANDNLNWEEQSNGYHVAEQMVGDIKVRVVLNRDRTRIVTAYPTNVQRNACPRAANDNRRD